MNDDLDFTKMLDEDRAAATPDVLRQVVARHRRRRARNYRLVATTAVVVALAGAGVGVGINANGHTKVSAARMPTARPGTSRMPTGDGPSGGPQPTEPPAGLSWAVSLPSAVPSAIQVPGTPATGVVATPAAPGVFGFTASSGPVGFAAARPPASPTNAGAGDGSGRATDCNARCGVVYGGGTGTFLFTRHVGGVTLTASLETFLFPVSLPPHAVPVSHGSSSGDPPMSPGATATSVLPAATPPPIPVEGICPASSELLVTISFKDTTETLLVPAGGPSVEPFSVVASAATRLPGGRSLGLAVARVSESVASVSARFASGASDAMVPRDGWVVLGQVLPAASNLATAGAASLEARSSTGADLERANLPASGSLATARLSAVCHYLVQPVNAVTAPPPASGGAPAQPRSVP